MTYRPFLFFGKIQALLISFFFYAPNMPSYQTSLLNFQYIKLLTISHPSIANSISFQLFLPSRISVDLPFILMSYSSYIDQMFKEAEDLERKIGFQRLMNVGDGLNTDDSQMSVINEMMSVISAQNCLIMKLLHAQNQLQQKYNHIIPSSESGSGNDKSRNRLSQDRSLEQSSSGSQRSPPDFGQRTNIVTFPKPLRVAREQRFSQVSEEEQQILSDFRDDRGGKPKQSETKNMIKNFAKAIFSFIGKHPETRARVLAAQGVGEAEFMAIVTRNKGRVHSIAELRGLWTREDNFGRVFRILSCEYLRKHCLQRTFNSRVENYGIHLKYRHRLLKGLKRPQDFTSLKMD